MKFSILYNDNDLIIVNKHVNVVTSWHFHQTLKKTSEMSLEELVKDHLKIEHVFACHRLDRFSSGALILAKTKEIKKEVERQFSERSIEKKYQAIVFGKLPQNECIVDVPILRSSRNRLLWETSLDGKKATTVFTSLKTTTNFSWICVKPITGRTHQIRVHLKYLGLSIVNDLKYGQHKLFGEYVFFLHATSIIFLHPITKKKLYITAPLPLEYNLFWKKINK